MTAEQIAQIRRENERLRQRIEELEILCGLDVKPRVELPVRRSERVAVVLALLLKRHLVTRLSINLAFGRDDDSDPRIVDVYVSSARKLLAKWGIPLKTDWGHGWYVEKQYREALRAHLTGEKAKAA